MGLRSVPFCVVFLLVLCCGWNGVALGAPPPIDEPFTYAPGQTLEGQDSGSGFSGPWFASGFNASIHNNYTTTGDSLDAAGIATEPGAMSTGPTGAIAGLGRNLASPILSGDTTTLYLSCLVRPEGALGQGVFNGFFGLYLDGTGNNDLFLGKPGSSAEASYVLEARGGAGQVSSGVPAVVGEAVLCVLRCDFTPGADTFTLYLNPDPCAPEPASGTVKSDLDLGSVTAVVLYSSGAFSLDELHLASTFDGVLAATGSACDLTPVVAEPFDYLFRPTGLDGRNGGSGFSGPWFPSGFNASISDVQLVQAGSLPHQKLDPQGESIHIAATNAIAGLGRNLEKPVAAASTLTFWWSFLLRPEGVLGAGALNGFFGVYLDGTGDSDLFAGKAGSTPEGNYVLEARGGAGQVLSPGPVVLGQSALIVVRCELQPGPDRFTLFVNPDPCGPEPLEGVIKEDQDLGDVSAIVIYSTGEHSLDEIHLGPTFESVMLATGLDCDAPLVRQRPGDCNQDGSLDISDPVCLLGYLFLGTIPSLPCAGGSSSDGANITLLDANGDGALDLSDSVSLLSFLFLGGPPPVHGLQCISIDGCPPSPSCQ